MNSKSFDYLTHVEEILERVKNTQWESMDACAGKMAEAIAGGHSVFAFGASHAGILAQELFYRTGGLAVLNAIRLRNSCLTPGPSPRQAPWKSWTATQLPS